MANASFPPDPAVTYVQTAVEQLYLAIRALPVTGADGSIAALGGAAQSLQNLLTSWYLGEMS